VVIKGGREWNGRADHQGEGALHTVNKFGQPVDNKWFGGSSIGIAYTSDVDNLQPNDMTIISVNQASPWLRETAYPIPAGMPPCPEGGCLCSWNWLHRAGNGEGYPYEMVSFNPRAMGVEWFGIWRDELMFSTTCCIGVESLGIPTLPTRWSVGQWRKSARATHPHASKAPRRVCTFTKPSESIFTVPPPVRSANPPVYIVNTLTRQWEQSAAHGKPPNVHRRMGFRRRRAKRHFPSRCHARRYLVRRQPSTHRHVPPIRLDRSRLYSGPAVPSLPRQ
jgi:hypothetical protein